MPDSVESRDGHYERRLNEAPSTENIISGLVRGADRSKKVIRLLSVCLVLILVLTLGLAFFAWRQAVEADKACVRAAQNSLVINKFLDLLITNTKISTTLTPAEKKDRVIGYTSLIIKIPDCYMDEKKPLDE